MELRTALDLFIAEFSAFETHFVGMALRSLSNDTLFVEQTEKLLGLEARLRLLKRMAFVRNVDPSLIAQLDEVNLRAGRLSDKRDELARNLRLMDSKFNEQCDRSGESAPIRRLATKERAALKNLWVPTVAEIDECRIGTTQLQATLRSIADQVGGYRHVAAGNLDMRGSRRNLDIPNHGG